MFLLALLLQMAAFAGASAAAPSSAAYHSPFSILDSLVVDSTAVTADTLKGKKKDD